VILQIVVKLNAKKMKMVSTRVRFFHVKLIDYHSNVSGDSKRNIRFIIPTHMSSNSINLAKIGPVHSETLGGICQIFSSPVMHAWRAIYFANVS